MKIYQDEIMDHYRTPRHKGRLAAPDFDTGQFNPSCGDAVAMQGVISDEILTDIAFEGKGCVISQAAASMLCAYAMHKPIGELALLKAQDMLDLVKIPLGPTRLRCALLCLEALQEGIKQYQAKKEHDVTSR